MQGILSLIDEFGGGGGPPGADINPPPVPPRTLRNLLLCFSKDRPYQLDQFLSSVHEHVSQCAGSRVVVLYKDTGEWIEAYDRVIRKYAARGGVAFVRERDFASDLAAIVEAASEEGEAACLLCVDDLVFTRPLDVSACVAALLAHPQALAYHAKLHPGVAYSHPASRACPPPPLSLFRHTPSGHELGLGARATTYLSFDLAQGTVDWRYPFDLCASIYRTPDLAALLALARAKDVALSNPNLLETAGNRLFWEGPLSRRYSQCLCGSAPCVSVVTVNRVQTEYPAVPIYSPSSASGTSNSSSSGGSSRSVGESPGGTEGTGAGLDLASLNRETRALDSARYSLDPVSGLTVHVGDVFFRQEGEGDKREEGSEAAAESSDSPSDGSSSSSSSNDGSFAALDCSILLPVYNAAAHLAACLDSLVLAVQSEQRPARPFRAEIVVMLDGCTDESARIARALTVPPSLQPCLSVRVEECAHRGLAATLDAGLDLCAADIVARMDADDLCEPGRLARQVAFLRNNPSIHVVGGQAVLLEEGVETGRGGLVGMVAAGVPTHPVLVHWTMHFRCCLLHPTATFRKSIVTECGGYCGSPAPGPASALCSDVDVIEDYSLWMRILAKYPAAVASLSDVVLQLRRRRDSKSSVQGAELRDASQRLRWACVRRLLGMGQEGQKGQEGEEGQKEAKEAKEAEEESVRAAFYVLVRPESLLDEAQAQACLALLPRMLSALCALHSLALGGDSPSAVGAPPGADILLALLSASCARLEGNVYRSAARKDIALPPRAGGGGGEPDVDVERLRTLLVSACQ